MSAPTPDIEFERGLPASLDAERTILGSILLASLTEEFILASKYRNLWVRLTIALVSLKLALRVACVLALGAVIALALTVRSDEHRAANEAINDSHAITAKISVDADEAHRLILEAGLTAREARLASADERGYLAQQNGQIAAALNNVNALVVSMRQTSDGVRNSQSQVAAQTTAAIRSATVALNGIQPLEQHLDGEVRSLNAATQHLDSLVSDPNIHATLAHLNGAAGDVQSMADDTKAKVHSMLHPKWPAIVANWTERIGVDVGRVLF